MAHTLDQLRTAYPKFSFTDYTWHVAQDDLHCSFWYAIEPTSPDFESLRFEHQLTFHHVASRVHGLSSELIDRWMFQLGVVELCNYWKLTCSPTIEISAGWLTPAQQDFWHHVLIHGMGEYFYLNQIDFTANDFLRIKAQLPPNNISTLDGTVELDPAALLIPVGGGKDSAVSLQLLSSKTEWPVTGLFLNPLAASKRVAQATNVTQQAIINRQLDPQLIDLNQRGYLNGHVPFSAVLAFLSTFFALLNQQKYVVLSNEQSSNEGTVSYLGHEINHQYSKTFDFEQKFAEYIANSPEFSAEQTPYYFSFLRPLYELQIAQLFAQDLSLLDIFRSCNRGQKADQWCNSCSKCLFAFVILAPFVPLPKLTSAFGANLLDDSNLEPIALELLGQAQHKPFECVGTVAESRVAFSLVAVHHPHLALIERIQPLLLPKSEVSTAASNLLGSWNSNHRLPQQFESLLRQQLQKVLHD